MSKFKNFIAAILVGYSSFLGAQNPSYFSSTPQFLVGSNNLTPSNSITISNVDKTRSSPQQQLLREDNTSAILLLKLDLGDDYIKAQGVFSITVNVNVICGSVNILKSITVNDKSPEALLKLDLLGAISGGGNNITISTTSATIDYETITPSSILTNYITSNIRLSAILQRTYAVDVRWLNSNGNVEIADPLSAVITPTINARLVHFQWQSNTNDGYPNYELQVLKVENTDVALEHDPDNIATTLDWSKALKVETQSSATTIDLTMAEGTGFYVWRVRPIGNYFDGGIANSQNYGQWNYSAADNDIVSFNRSMVSSGQKPYAFYFTDPDENVNWIYNRVFTEGDNSYQNNQTGVKVKEGMNYADGLLRSRQSQTFNSSNGTTVVSQTISDYSGRPAATTLPVPINGGLTGYKANLAQNSSGQSYTAKEFDTDNNESNPVSIKDNGTSFSYYSNNASSVNNDNVPNADGYAFTRVKFKNDGTGRKEEESGVGIMHSIGTDPITGMRIDGRGRTTRYYYSTATDDELIRVFGDEAPLAESVIKTTTVDPNDVISVTYTSKEGKTIATSLISENTDNLLPLDNTAIPAFTITNVADQNIVSNGSFISSKRIAVPLDQLLVTLNYSLDGTPSLGCISGGCNYKLRFYLVDIKSGNSYESDENGDLSNGFQSFTATQGQQFLFPSTWKFFTKDGAHSLQYVSGSSTYNQFNLHQGEYLFVKEIYATTDANTAKAAVNEQQLKYKLILDAIADIMRATQSDAGAQAFTAFTSSLSATIATYQASSPDAASDATFTTQLLQILGLKMVSQGGTVPNDYIFPRDFNLAPIPHSQGTTSELTISIPTSDCGGCGDLKTQVPKPDICFACDGSDLTGEVQVTDMDAMIAANATAIANNADVLYGIKDIFSDPNFALLTTDDQKRSKIDAIVDYYFVNMLRDTMTNANIPFTDLYKITPGFTFDLLKFMFSNMLISKYYTGKSIKGGDGVWYVAQQNTSTGAWEASSTKVADLQNEYNYDCKKLFNAWTTAVNTLNSFDNSDNTNVVQGFNNQDKEGPHSAENEADDESNWEDLSKRQKRKLEKNLSEEMDNFSGSGEANIPKTRMDALSSIISIFMNQTEYQFAAIIDGGELPTYIDNNNDANHLPDDYESTPSSILPDNPFYIQDPSGFGSSSKKSVPVLMEETFNYTFSPCGSKILTYPYIVKPEWMFKYYVYNVYGNPLINDKDRFLPNQVIRDLKACYNLPSSYITYTDQLCQQPCDANNLHNNWNADERNSFYLAVKGDAICWENKGIGGDSYNNNTPPVCDSKATLIDSANNEINRYISICSTQTSQIKTALIGELEASCYTIVECQTSSGAGQVTMKEIDAMVQKVVKQCEDEIKKVGAKLPVNVAGVCTMTTTTGAAYGCNETVTPPLYPNCVHTGCINIVLKNTNELFTEGTVNIETKLFQDCDLNLMQLLTSGDFLPKIPPLPGCTTNTASKEWEGANCGVPCTSGDCEGKQYKNYSAEFQVPAQQ